MKKDLNPLAAFNAKAAAEVKKSGCCTIYKYQVTVADSFDLEMPKDARILSVQTQRGVPCIWALVNPKAEKQTRTFAIYGTGNPIAHDPDNLKFLGTFQDGMLVWHLFEEVV